MYALNHRKLCHLLLDCQGWYSFDNEMKDSFIKMLATTTKTLKLGHHCQDVIQILPETTTFIFEGVFFYKKCPYTKRFWYCINTSNTSKYTCLKRLVIDNSDSRAIDNTKLNVQCILRFASNEQIQH